MQIINLGIGSPDLLPPKEVIDILKSSADEFDANKYQSYKGQPALRAAFSGWYKSHFEVMIDQNTEILPLMGSKEGIMHIHMSLLNEGDEVLVDQRNLPTEVLFNEPRRKIRRLLQSKTIARKIEDTLRNETIFMVVPSSQALKPATIIEI